MAMRHKMAFIVVHANDGPILFHREWHSIQAFATFGTAETCGMKGGAQGLQNLHVQKYVNNRFKRNCLDLIFKSKN
jgi:hypothetical protein